MSDSGTAFLDSLITEQRPPPVTVFDSEGRPRKQSDVLLDIGRIHDLFHDRARNAYAGVGKAVYAIESAGYRELLAESFLATTNKGCNRNSIVDAISTLASLAKFRGNCRDVWLRVGGDSNGVVIDTGNANHDLIDITANGWKLIEGERPEFRRVGAMQPLPEPAAPDFSRLWNYVTVAEEHRPLVAGWMLAALRPVGPYPLLIFSGEQGTGKSTQGRVVRRLTDPSASPLRAPPKEVRDLLVGALNGWVLAVDNLSGINPQLSDALCRLSTGGAISERALYSNTDEILVEVQRPVILNGIEDIATRPDLAERSLHIELEPITLRRTEAEFWRAFDQDAPRIFGALLEGLVCSIRDHATIQLGRLPRMADFATWAAAGMEPLGFTADQFISAYRANIQDGQTASVESSPVGEAVTRLMTAHQTWTGTASELMAELARVADDAMTRNPTWPKSPRWMTGTITRLAPALRAKGISVDRQRSGDSRAITLCRAGKIASLASQRHEPIQETPTNDANDDNDDKNHMLHSARPSPKPALEDAEEF